MLVAIDGGNHDVKICSDKGYRSIPSAFTRYKELQVAVKMEENDFIVEYKGTKWFAGGIANREDRMGSFGKSSNMFGDTKLHADGIRRILLGITQSGVKGDIDLVVGQPIKTHSRDKEKIQQALLGDHVMTVNNHEHRFTIRNVQVAPEGLAAYPCIPSPDPLTRIVDIGSGTVNFGTMENGKRVNRGSDTITNGVETADLDELMEYTAKALVRSGWDTDEKVWVCGGKASEGLTVLKEYYPNARIINPVHENVVIHSKYAVAVGLYRLGKLVYMR